MRYFDTSMALLKIGANFYFWRFCHDIADPEYNSVDFDLGMLYCVRNQFVLETG